MLPLFYSYLTRYFILGLFLAHSWFILGQITSLVFADFIIGILLVIGSTFICLLT